ncbi:MAG: DUF1648 domain-containing protein [Prevotellaceae bacterium]|jgi:hypothetical protein|nr:DUF1648 domain-containing protein [Prevotellaceae bacterium]
MFSLIPNTGVLRRDRYDYILEALSGITLLATYYPLLFYQQLDAAIRIPIHYNVAGEIDGWGNPSSLWTLPLVATAFYLLFSLSERFYRHFNYPIKRTAYNEAYLYRLGIRLMRHLKVLLLLLFAYLNNVSYLIAIGKAHALSMFVMSLFFILLIGTLVVFYVRMSMYKE